MYMPRITPVQRMRGSGGSTTSSSHNGGSNGGGGGGGNRRSLSATQAVAPCSAARCTTTPKRRTMWQVGAPAGTINRNADYHTLQSTVEKDRQTLQESRVRLASSLDQLGEHHVRQKEYDDAMDAFTEALKEKRSVFWHVTTQSSSTTMHSRSTGSSMHSSLLSGFTDKDEDESTTFSNKDPAAMDRFAQGHVSTTQPQESAVDELIATLRNMGNVHSLRGEQDEAMRYYTEVTNLRAKKAAMMAAASSDNSVETRSLLSGLNDENSALMSEINEDVKALDDLFRSISFRNHNSEGNLDIDGSSAGASPEKRKSSKHSNSNKKRRSNHYHSSSHNNAHSGSRGDQQIVENEPFNRSISPTFSNNGSHHSDGPISSSYAPGNEASDAMDMYRLALESYGGSKERLDQHREMLNSLTLRCDLLNEKRQQAATSGHKDHFFAHSGTSAKLSSMATGGTELYPDNHALSTKAADLELALAIYQYVLIARQEGQAAFNAASTMSSMSVVAPPASPSASSSVSSNHKSESSIDGPISSEKQEPPQSPLLPEDQHQQQVAASHIASTLIAMGSIYYKLGNRMEELKMYKEAKTVYRKAFGEQHVFVAGTRKNIGMVLAERGEYEKAMEQFEKAMKIYVAVHKKEQLERKAEAAAAAVDTADEEGVEVDAGGEEDSLMVDEINDDNVGVMSRDVASAISCMGNVKNRVGELDGALGKYMQALQIYKSIYQTARHASPSTFAITAALRDVTSTLKVIGMVHSKKGDLDTAMSFFQEAMTLLREGGGDEDADGSAVSSFGFDDLAGSAIHETMASVLTRIASIHLKKGDLNAAMSHYREAYDVTIRNCGTTNHSEVAGILHYIGGIYHKQSNYEEAMACYQESIRIYHATLGPGNPTVAGTLVMVGSIHYKRRNLDSAMMFYREALRLNRDAYGMHHPDVAPILKSIGTILTKKGDYQDAYDIFRDVLSIKCTVHGTDHPEVASAYKSLGNVHYKLGDLADAERQYRHALSIYRRCKGEDHADTVAAKTTIEHLRYWMRERDQQKELERRNSLQQQQQQQAYHHHSHQPHGSHIPEQRQSRNTGTVHRSDTAREI